MTKKHKIQILTSIIILLVALCLLTSKEVFAQAWQVIDVNTPDNNWTEDGLEGTFKKTITLYVGDTFTNLYDSTLEGAQMTPPQILLDYSNIITDKGNGTYEVTAAGSGSKTYLSDGSNGWTKKTIYINTKEKEVQGLTISSNTVSMNTKETKKLQFTIKALKGYDSIHITNNNSKVVSASELTNNRLRTDTGETTYTYKLTPLKAGTAIITVSSRFDPTIRKTLTVTVKAAETKKPVYYVSSTNGKYTYSAMTSDLLSITKFHQADKPVKLLKIGTSLDKRSIYCLQIGNPKAKKKIIYTAGIHGREYMNPYFVMDNIEEMLNHYDTAYSKKGYTYRQLYNQVCLYVIPMLNPDGISIAQQGANAIQNKTLRANVKKIQKRLGISYSRWKGNAKNVDLNRNFPSGWEKLSSYRKEGSSGSKAGSEPETKCMMNYINTIKPTAVISYHSMGELFYWGYAISKSSTCYKQALGMKKIVSRLTGYYAVPAHRSTKDACGCLEDWLAYKKKIPSVCVETGNVACPLPASQYNRLYSKNKMVVEEICKYFR